MGQDNTTPRRINRGEGVAGQCILSGGPGAVETWGAPVPAVHGAARHTDITREKFLSVGKAYISTGALTNGILEYCELVGGANLDEPQCWWTMKVPDDFVSFTSVQAVWLCAAAAGNMYWELGAHYDANGETYPVHTDNPAAGVTATGGAMVVNVQAPANPLTLANLAIGDYIGLSFRRSGSDANDTLDADVFLWGLLFTYVANQ